MQKYDDKIKKNSLLEAQGKKIKVLVMILFSLFFVNFISATFGSSLDEGLITYFNFNESSGTTAYDSLFANNGSHIGTIGLAQEGKSEYAYNMTSATHVNLTTMTGIVDGNNSRSISLWFYPHVVNTSYMVIFSQGLGAISNTREWTLGYDSTYLYVDYAGASYNCVTTLAKDNWYHIIMVYNGTGTNFYLNGTSLCNTSAYNSVVGKTDLRIGRRIAQTSGGMMGRIDEFGYWNKTINSSEMSELWNSGYGRFYDIGTTYTGILVNLTSPVNTSTISTNSSTFEVNLSYSGIYYNYSWSNATYYLWFSNGTTFNTTVVTGLSGNETNFSRTINYTIIGSYIWNVNACYSNATYSRCNLSTDGNHTFSYVPFSNVGEVYSVSTYETKNETFYINITTIEGTSNMGAFLVYNGTYYAASHTCSGSLCQISRKIDIPLLFGTGSSELKPFFWQITIFGTFGTSTQNTTTHNQNVSNLIFNNCNVAWVNNSVNFTIYNETNLDLVNVGFKSTFKYWLGDGTVKDEYNFSGFGHNHYLFCVNQNLSYITDSEIIINGTTNSRIYQFIRQLYSNTLIIQKLFLPDDSYTSNIIIEVKNQGLIPQQFVSVNISRYYPDLNRYENVENQVTDEFGQIMAKLIETNVKYKFDFYDASGNLLKTSDKITIICRSSICVVPFIIETSEDYLNRYDNYTLFDYQLTFDNTTNIFTYSWDDQRGENAIHRLLVIRYSFNQSEVVCNTTSTSLVSSLTCDVGDSPASYTAQTFRKINGKSELRISYLNVIVGDYSSTFGIEGLFWVFILLFVCIGIGVYDPKVGAVIYGFGFILMGILKIIYMPLEVFFANTILVALFVWAVRT